MKKVVIICFVFFAVSLMAQTAAPAVQKIGYVDSEVILQQFPEAIKAKSDLEGLGAKWKKELDSIAADAQKAYAEYQKEAEKKKPEELKAMQQKLAEKEQRYTQLQQQKFGQPNGEYFQRQEALMKPIKAKIFKAIEDISKEEGMNFVFDKVGDQFLLKADAQFDITFKVLDLLKRGKK